MKEIEKIVELLGDESLEKRIAAAIVLGEIGARGSEVSDALLVLTQHEAPQLRRHAAEALGKIVTKKVAVRLFPLLMDSSEEVRRAAREAIVAAGEEVVPEIRAKMNGVSAEERQALDAVLAELGGKEAFTVLLESVASADVREAKSAAIAVRQRMKSADGKLRRSYLAETERFLKKLKKSGASPQATAAGIKILGFMEDEATVPILLEHAADEEHPASVRQEAVIALRFPLQKQGVDKKVVKEVASVLIEVAAEATDRMLAQTALHTLAGVDLSTANAKAVEKLLLHPDIERARFAIEQLGRQKDGDSAKLLVRVVQGPDKKRAELALAQLATLEEGTNPLAKALLEIQDPDRAWAVRNVLRPLAKKVSGAVRRQLLDAALERMVEATPGWEALIDVARDGDPEAVAEALHALIAKLRKQKKQDKILPVLSVLAKSDAASPEDTYLLASLELSRSAKDLRARDRDKALKTIAQLLEKDYDVAAAMRKDKSLELEDLYYVGFHFIEAGESLGLELLEHVVKEGGRTKLAKMAKNKLKIAEA
ncbi:MAG: HEAT repeat domain-containing protein [Myxococcota bacterium]